MAIIINVINICYSNETIKLSKLRKIVSEYREEGGQTGYVINEMDGVERPKLNSKRWQASISSIILVSVPYCEAMHCTWTPAANTLLFATKIRIASTVENNFLLVKIFSGPRFVVVEQWKTLGRETGASGSMHCACLRLQTENIPHRVRSWTWPQSF